MKAIAFGLGFALWTSVAVHAQGTLLFNNLANTGAAGSSSNGLVFINYDSGWSLLNEDVNFKLYAGGVGPSQQQPIKTWLISDGSARGIATGSGHFADPAGETFSIPGVAPGDYAFIQIEAWAGNYPTFQDAENAGAPLGRVIFGNPTGGNGAPAESLVMMPNLGMFFVPEPSTFAIVLTCGLALLGSRLWKASKPKPRVSHK